MTGNGKHEFKLKKLLIVLFRPATLNGMTPADQDKGINSLWKKDAKKALRQQKRKEAAIEREQFFH